MPGWPDDQQPRNKPMPAVQEVCDPPLPTLGRIKVCGALWSTGCPSRNGAQHSCANPDEEHTGICVCECGAEGSL